MPRSTTVFRLLLLIGTVLAGPAIAQELPTGATVGAGTVAISTLGPGAMSIDQSSQSAIVNWQSFSVGKGGSVTIAQPNGQSVILNRVTGSADTSIAGEINANGQVFIVNPNGIAITPSGTVRTGGFVGSSLGISDQDFLSGHYVFKGNGASAPVSNAGDIAVTSGGYAALIGGHVSNSGLITAPLGKVGLGAGEQVTLDLSGDGFLQVALPSDFRDEVIKQSGTIKANGGRVVISAAAAQDAARRVVNLSGVVEARTVSGRSGAIVLGGGGGAVKVSGRLDVSARAAAPRRRTAARGGSVTITGGAIDLASAIVDASGADGGGDVRIGGDFHGAGPLPNAQTVSVDAATTILADATVAGDGGSVVLWSDATTDFAGKISARGAGAEGVGGNVEVSSKNLLDYAGLADLSAPSGDFGTLLLDPYNVIITDDGSDFPGGNNYNEDTTSDPRTFTPDGDDSHILTSTLDSELGQANVTINTGSSGTQAGDITVAAEIDWTPSVTPPIPGGTSPPTTLTLNAARDIILDAGIDAPNGGLILTAGRDISVGPDLQASELTITVGSAGMTATAGSIDHGTDFGGVDAVITSGGDVALTTNSGDLLYQGTIKSTAGRISLTSANILQLDGLVDPDGVISAAGDVGLVAGAGGMTINGPVTSGGNVLARSDGPLTIDAGASVASTGANGAVIIDAATFDNLAGADAVAVTGGNRFLIFTDDWRNDTPGGLAGSHRYGIAYDTGVEDTIPGTDNEFISDAQPTLTVTIPNGTRIYGQTLAPVSVTTVTGLVNGDTLLQALGANPVATDDTTPTSAGVGTYANALQGGGITSPIGYVLDFVFGSITVDAAPLTITANDLAKTYGQTLAFDGTEFTTTGLVNGDTVGTVTLTSTGAPATATVGPYAIVPSGATGTGIGNYDITYVDGTLTVNPAALTITANDLSKTYGQTLAFDGTEFTTVGLVNGDTVGTVTLTSAGAPATATVGPYAIVASGAIGTGLGNYAITYVDGTLTVNPAALTITSDNLTKLYGDTLFLGDTSFTTAGLVNGDVVSSVVLTSTGAPAAAAVSAYTIVPSGAIGTGLGNYDITYQDGTLTLNPAPLTITAADRSKPYGLAAAFHGTEFTTAGLLNGDTVTFATLTSPGAPAAAAVGAYTIVPSGATGTGLGNYDITYTDGTLTVAANGAAAPPASTASYFTPTGAVALDNPADTLPGGLEQPVTQQDAKLSLQILEQRSQQFEDKVNQCQQVLTLNHDSSAFITCEANALDQYADSLEDPLIKLPPELQATVGVIRQTVQRLRSAATMTDKRAALAQAHVAVQSLIGFVRQQVTLVRAAQPETQTILAQHGAVMVQALQHLDTAMVRAAGV